MGRLLTILVAVGFCASLASADVAQNFFVTRDNSVDQNNKDNNLGAAFEDTRGAKQTYEEDSSFFDWNMPAVNSFIDTNGGVANVTGVKLFIKQNADPYSTLAPGSTTGKGIRVYLLRSTNDWAEGNGTTPWDPSWNNYSFNWTTDTAAATYNYAQCYQVGGVLDPTRSLRWKNPDTGAEGDIASLYTNASPGRNSLDWTPGLGALAEPERYIGVDLDTVFWQNLLDRTAHPEVHGVILWDYENVGGNNNWWLSTREDGGGGGGAYLEITMIPEPASMTLLAAGVLGLVSRRRR